MVARQCKGIGDRALVMKGETTYGYFEHTSCGEQSCSQHPEVCLPLYKKSLLFQGPAKAKLIERRRAISHSWPLIIECLLFK